jgi:hypothetical protein
MRLTTWPIRDGGIDAVGADVLGCGVGFGEGGVGVLVWVVTFGAGVAVEAGDVPVPLVDVVPFVEADEDVAVPIVAVEVAALVTVAGEVGLAFGV